MTEVKGYERKETDGLKFSGDKPECEEEEIQFKNNAEKGGKLR